MQVISLEKYNIYFGDIDKTLQNINWEQYSQIICLCDENTEKYCLPSIIPFISHPKINALRIQSGEIHKNLRTCERIWKELLEFQVDRKSLLLNVGGGVIGDMGGFCASTFKRGFDFIQIPTTLLSQVDASIGSKLGIDFNGIKNIIGVFQDPKAVLIDTKFLKTLSFEEIRSGFAEIIKHALINDKNQWEYLKTSQDILGFDWNLIIPDSLSVKRNIVLKDPLEKNIRKALNFGHTIGHAVESYSFTTSKPLLHGESIAIGMITETFLSFKKGFVSYEELKLIATYIYSVYGKIALPIDDIWQNLLEFMFQDKKNEDNIINFTFLNGIGNHIINQNVAEREIYDAFVFYNTFDISS